MIFRCGFLATGQKSRRRSWTAAIVRHLYGVTRYRSAAEVRRLPDPLGIPTVLDRVIQQAILQVLQPIFDPEFSGSSYGFRPGRSAHDAVRRVRAVLDEGYTWVVDIDLAKFFDRVNHDVLMARVARKVKDKRVLRLIGYMKQWRRIRTRIRNLLRLGAPKSQAIPVGLSCKGPWWLARTYATQLGMNNAWLKEQGLVSVRDLWIAFHYSQ